MPEFSHLHCHTTYSLLDGAARIDKLVNKAKKLGMKGLAITDHGNMFGVPEFYTTARKAGIKPVIGCEFYLTPSGMQDRKNRTRHHQLLLARNEIGYQNLVTLSSLSYSNGFYYKPRIDFETLAKYSEGLIATTCCIQGAIPQAILINGEEQARETFKKYLEVFGEHFYIEIQPPVIDDQERVNQTLVRWSTEFKVPIIATNDVHYVEAEDFNAQEVLLCLQSNTKLSDPNRWTFGEGKLYLKSADEMLDELGGPKAAASWLDRTGAIVDQCNVELKLDQLLMPHYPIPEQFDNNSGRYLRHLVFEGAKRRYPELSSEVTDRLNLELGIIEQMGYAGYFLIVQDFTTEARKMQVDVGPGRGSAAGSAVAYCLGITNIDPLKYGLLFERFLNPERVSMPDIDIDFDDVGRGKVIDYVISKYGRDNVCQIITYGTMGAKTAIRDVARVLEISMQATNRIAGFIPDTLNITLAEALKESQELRDELDAAKELIKRSNAKPGLDSRRLSRRDQDRMKIPDLLRFAQILEGGVRHTGVHAAGVIIAPGPVSDYIPTAIAKSKGEQVLTTQFDGNWVERFGLLKMDFLGLTTLTILRETIGLIAKSRGETVDLDSVPLDDQETFKLFQRGETAGIFQFESSGMRRWLMKLRPTDQNDLIAMNALYRPGPMELIPDYIARKHGERPVEYLHECLKPVLVDTFGLPVYQEQVMQMAQVMAGYTLGEADVLRRAMGKKKKKVMAKQKSIFIGKAKERDIPARIAEKTFAMMEKFAGYGFNKCLAGGTTITHAVTGEQITLETLYYRGPNGFLIHAVDSSGRVVARLVTDVFDNGVQNVYTVTTGSGRAVTSTATHRFLTPHGWRRLAELKQGDVLFTPRPEFYLNLQTLHAVADGAGGVATIEPPDVHLGQAESELVPDGIVSIVPAGRVATFDLTVAEHHNYLASGLVVHNSHSAAYSLVAYQAAYLKANYTPEFMAAVLTSVAGDSKKFAYMLGEARRLNLELVLPCVNQSYRQFTVEGRKIRFGLGSIKGLSTNTIDAILRSRKESGPARTLFGLARSLTTKDLNRKTLECLIHSGALDDVQGHRAQKTLALDTALHDANQHHRAKSTNQISLFGAAGSTSLPEPDLTDCPPASRAEELEQERQFIGAFVSGHPLDDCAIELAAINPTPLDSADVQNGNGYPKVRRTFCGVITGVSKRKTSQGNYVLDATIEDKSGQGSILCFADIVRQASMNNMYHRTLADDVLRPGEVFRIRGEVETNGGNIKVLVRNLRDLAPLSRLQNNFVRLLITLASEPTDLRRLRQFAQVCQEHPGNSELWFQIRHDGQWTRLRSSNTVLRPSTELIRETASLFGQDKVQIRFRNELEMEKPLVLFICTHNSARSQMAEGLLRNLYPNHYETGSAGTRPAGVSPHAIEVMKEIDIDISGHTSDSLDDFADPPPDYAFTLCDSAADSCPRAYARRRVVHHSFEDPRAVSGSEADKRQAFRRVRDAIKAWISEEFDPRK